MSKPVEQACPHAYRRVGTVSIYCKKQPNIACAFCGHQYFCNITGRWEVSSQAADCALRKETGK